MFRTSRPLAGSLLMISTSCVFRASVNGQASTASSQLDAARASHAYEEAVREGPAALRAYLTDFPKGADLHVHLSGAVYAETLIRDAAEDGLCVDTVEFSLAQPPCTGVPDACRKSNRKHYARRAVDLRQAHRLALVAELRALSGRSGHDQFFMTFDRDGAPQPHNGEWVDEVATRAAAQNEQYLELMDTPPFTQALKIADAVGWSPELQRGDPAAFARFRQQLLDRGLREEVAADRETLRQAEAERRRLEHCGTAEATSACQVEIRYIWAVLRDFPPQQVFAQTLLGFETAQATIDAHEPGFVGINLVRPEDDFVAMRDYTLQMKMVGYLHSVYPSVHIALHAGELTLGLVPPAGLRFHIRQAVTIAHAQRIGHGVDVMYEENAAGLLREMAAGHLMVEINLTSNQDILGVSGAEHPFPMYRAAHVPVALSTDDEGVSRIDLTHEYEKAALEYHLSYNDLKQLARTGMEHDFLPGASLWAEPDAFNVPAAACRGQVLGGDHPTVSCRAFLKGSEKAAAQWELERRFLAFQARF